MSAVGERLVKLSNRLYDRMRDPGAFTAARGEATARDFAQLRGAKYCLLVTYRRSGEPVPTPVWFGLDAEGTLYVRTEARGAKVKRIRANPAVKVAPATQRGRPTGPLAEGRARVLGPADEQRAERALRANYGVGRRFYEALGKPLGVPLVYLEVTPAAAKRAPESEAGAAGATEGDG
jgi:PPOX class probable F420-dependent enzyme